VYSGCSVGSSFVVALSINSFFFFFFFFWVLFFIVFSGGERGPDLSSLSRRGQYRHKIPPVLVTCEEQGWTSKRHTKTVKKKKKKTKKKKQAQKRGEFRNKRFPLQYNSKQRELLSLSLSVYIYELKHTISFFKPVFSSSFLHVWLL
jgi:hypothetical protein